jgi:DNA polymerase III delta subunit
MLTIIHGDDHTRARAQFTLLKSSSRKEIRELSGKKFDAAQFVQATESSSLFGNDLLIVGENILSSANKREKAYQLLVATISRAAESADILLYEEKELDKTTANKLTGAKLYLHKLPVLIFQFLDNLRPGQGTSSAAQLTALLSTEPAEVIYTLLVRRVRQLIQLADHVSPEGLAEWQQGRLTAQSRFFTMEKLLAMHTQLVEADISIKTGASPFTLAQLLTHCIVSL